MNRRAERAPSSVRPARPASEGTLADHPLVLFLVSAFDEGFTGTLLLIDARSRRHTIYFAKGLPSQAHTPCRIAPLGAVLREMGLIDEAALIEREERSGHNTILLSRDLLGDGLLSELHLRRALGIQLARRLRSLLALPPQTAYALYPNVNLVPGSAHGLLSPISPLPLLLPGLKARAADLPIDEALERLHDSALSLRPIGRQDELGLAPNDPLLEALRCPSSLSDLLSLPDPENVRLKLYALLVTKSVLVMRKSGPPRDGETWPAGGAVSSPHWGPIESGIHERVTPSSRRIDPSVRWGTRSRKLK